jgi:hypothetical protein
MPWLSPARLPCRTQVAHARTALQQLVGASRAQASHGLGLRAARSLQAPIGGGGGGGGGGASSNGAAGGGGVAGDESSSGGRAGGGGSGRRGAGAPRRSRGLGTGAAPAAGRYHVGDIVKAQDLCRGVIVGGWWRAQ